MPNTWAACTRTRGRGLGHHMQIIRIRMHMGGQLARCWLTALHAIPFYSNRLSFLTLIYTMGAGLQRRLAVRLPLRLLSPAMAGHQPMHSPPQETRCPRPCRAVAECLRPQLARRLSRPPPRATHTQPQQAPCQTLPWSFMLNQEIAAAIVYIWLRLRLPEVVPQDPHPRPSRAKIRIAHIQR